MEKHVLFYLLVLAILACNDDDDLPAPTAEYEGYTLVWSDEFDASAINNSNWTYELGDGTNYGLPPGWGNNELQIYTDDVANSYIEKDADGVSALVISAMEESPGNYTSAKLTTQGLQSFRYGRIEARMKLPFGEGMWPAFWMLGDNITDVDWPGCGEIDIMEMVGFEPNRVHGTVHYTTSENRHNSIGGSDMIPSGNLSDAYHDYRIDWTPTEVIFSFDGVPYHTVPFESDMKEFQRSFYLILNIAVGGNWPGPPDATTSFPQKMYVDYVRVYSKDDLTAPAAPALNIDEETIGVVAPANQARYAFNSTLNQFPETSLKSFGGGGEPVISTSDIAIEGDSSLLFSYLGGNWGGGWFEMGTPLDMSSFANDNLIFSIQQSGALADAEIKLEAVSNSAAVFIKDYSPTPVANGYVQYTIPISDFSGLDLSAIKIPFAFWNPTDSSGEYPAVDVFIDNIYWE